MVPELQADDRNGVVVELVSLLEQAGQLGKAGSPEIQKEIIKREKEASTGMGKGVAVPHIKHKSIKHVAAAIGLSRDGIDFSALDKQPVYSVILLVSPLDNPEQHLKAMESVFKHLQKEKFRKFLRQCRTPEQIKDLIQEADDDPSL